MLLSIIVIGAEILLGRVTDTNSGYISRSLEPKGWETRRVVTVGDNAADIRAAIELCMADSDLIITTGGLGPTKDDITKPLMLDIFGGEMVRDGAVTANIERIFQKRELQLNRLTLDQALVPSSCRVIQNLYGTAPIMWFETLVGASGTSPKVLIAMPGVPFETEGMIRGEVGEAIQRRFHPEEVFLHRTFIITGISESALATELEDYELSLPDDIHLAYLPGGGVIKLRLDGREVDEKVYNAAAERLKTLVAEYLVAEGDVTPAEIVISRLRERGYTVATAESCTGGNIAHLITSVAGCSDVMLGGVVSYANSAKQALLGVKEETLAKFGAVSRETVEEMALGAAKAFGADCAVATSGIAGPSGGSSDKPVGTVWIAVAVRERESAHEDNIYNVYSERYRFPGDRDRVIERASITALLNLAKFL